MRSSTPCASVCGRPRRPPAARRRRAAPPAGSPGRSPGSGSAWPHRHPPGAVRPSPRRAIPRYVRDRSGLRPSGRLASHRRGDGFDAGTLGTSGNLRGHGPSPPYADRSWGPPPTTILRSSGNFAPGRALGTCHPLLPVRGMSRRLRGGRRAMRVGAFILAAQFPGQGQGRHCTARCGPPRSPRRPGWTRSGWPSTTSCRTGSARRRRHWPRCCWDVRTESASAPPSACCRPSTRSPSGSRRRCCI